MQAREDLAQDITAWLDPDVPRSWTLPERLIDSIVLKHELERPFQKDDIGTMYVTHLKLDKSPAESCPVRSRSTTTSWSAGGW